MQINFNGTNFIDLLIFTNLINIADPLVIFSLQKSTQTWLFSPSKKQSLRIAGTAAWAQGLAVHSQRTHRSLSLSLCASSVKCAAGSWGAALSVKHRYYIASLVLYDASIAKSKHWYCLYLMCIWFHRSTARFSGFLFRLTSWKGELVM